MHDDDPATATVKAAETVVFHARWCIYEEQALARLADVAGLSCTRLFPQGSVIHVVAYDGAPLGRVRRARPGTSSPTRHGWVAVPLGEVRELGYYRTLRSACRALARAAGHRAATVHPAPASVGQKAREPGAECAAPRHEQTRP